MAEINDVTSEALVCNGVEVRYWARSATNSAESAPTLIFLHNAGTDHTIWKPVADLLSERFDTVLLDWPGYGESRSEPNGHSLGDYGEVLSSFLDQKAFSSIVLVGNCLGSGVALEYCQRNMPKEVRALVLFNILVPSTLGIHGRFVFGWSKSNWQGVYNKIQQKIVVPKQLGSLIVRYQLKSRSRVSNSLFRHLVKLNESPENVRNLGGLVGSLKQSEHLDSIAAGNGLPRTMVVWGKKNRVLPLSAGKRFVESFGPEEFHVEDGGHLVMLEQPAICAKRIETFIERADEQSIENYS